MKTQKFFVQGSEFNKMQFSEIESYLEDKGMNVNAIFSQIADENEFIYVSNGFVNGLSKDENSKGEWHHYFTKNSDGTFDAGKLMFN
jgi:hypothetical protein